MAARAGDVMVKPTGNAWTEFQVKDVDGRVEIAANKGDVTVQDDQGTTTVSQGQQATREDTNDPEKKKKKKRHGTGAEAAAHGGIMSSSTAVYAGIGGAAGAAIWIWTRSEPPVSNSCPSKSCP